MSEVDNRASSSASLEPWLNLHSLPTQQRLASNSEELQAARKGTGQPTSDANGPRLWPLYQAPLSVRKSVGSYLFIDLKIEVFCRAKLSHVGKELYIWLKAILLPQPF